MSKRCDRKRKRRIFWFIHRIYSNNDQRFTVFCFTIGFLWYGLRTHFIIVLIIVAIIVLVLVVVVAALVVAALVVSSCC